MINLEIAEFDGKGYFSPYQYGVWKIAYINWSEAFAKENITYLERHNETDEVFVLLAGSATLYLGEKGEPTEMEPCKAYVVKQSAWHPITVSKDAKVLIVENTDTTRKNSDYMDFKIV